MGIRECIILSFILLVDNSANIMYSSNRTQIGQQYIITVIYVPNSLGYYTDKIDGKNCLIAYCKSYKTNWTEFIVIPMNVVLNDFKPIKKEISGILSMSLRKSIGYTNWI